MFACCCVFYWWNYSKLWKSYSSSAHPLLVLQEHVLLEQHLLQPGRAHEPPCGLLLPSGRFPWRSVNFCFITPEVLVPNKPHCFIEFLKLHCFIEVYVLVGGEPLLNSQFLLKKNNEPYMVCGKPPRELFMAVLWSFFPIKVRLMELTSNSYPQSYHGPLFWSLMYLVGISVEVDGLPLVSILS